MLGILKKKKIKTVKGLGLLTLFISPNATFTDVVTLVHLGTKADRQKQARLNRDCWLQGEMLAGGSVMWDSGVHQSIRKLFRVAD